MKKGLLKTILVSSFAIVSVFGLGFTVMNADSIDDPVTSEEETTIPEDYTTYTLEEMLIYAISDEYLAQAEYRAIIETYGEVRPFTNIVNAEQTHIDLLLELFTTYGYEVPENNAQLDVVVPESISAAIALGIEAEKKNIAIYEAFLAQTDLPEDVRSTFEYLLSASINHLNAFSKNRLYGLGSDLANQFRNQFRKGNGNGSGNQYKGSNSKGNGSGNQYRSTNGTSGVCPNN